MRLEPLNTVYLSVFRYFEKVFCKAKNYLFFWKSGKISFHFFKTFILLRFIGIFTYLTCLNLVFQDTYFDTIRIYFSFVFLTYICDLSIHKRANIWLSLKIKLNCIKENSRIGAMWIWAFSSKMAQIVSFLL